MDRSKQLSVQQLAAYHSILQVFKTYQNKQPKYIHDSLFPDEEFYDDDQRISRSTVENHIRVEGNLSLTRSGFMYRASKLWNALPPEVRSKQSIATFKLSAKLWIKDNIATIPE